MKTITIFLTLSLLLKSGCANNEFESKVEEGKIAIINEEYEKALVSFESALEEKSYDDKKVSVLIDQTEKMINAIKQQEIGNEFKAIGFYKQVKEIEGGYDILSERAEERKETLKQAERDKYEEQLTQAEGLKDNEEYEEAKELLTAIIHKAEVYKYLEEQYKKATEMYDEIEVVQAAAVGE